MEQIKTLEGLNYDGLIHAIGQRIRSADERRMMAYEEVGHSVLAMATQGEVEEGQSEQVAILGMLFENIMLGQSIKNGFSETS